MWRPSASFSARLDVSDRIVAHRSRWRHRRSRPAVRPPELKLAMTPSLDSIALLVDRAMVPPTEHREIRERGGPAVRPMADVVALTESRAATGEATAAITVLKRAPQGGRNRSRPRANAPGARPMRWTARRATVTRGEVVLAVLLNIGWVVGSAAQRRRGPRGHGRAGLHAARDRRPPPAQRGLTVLRSRRRSRTIGRHEARQRGPPRRALRKESR